MACFSLLFASTRAGTQLRGSVKSKDAYTAPIVEPWSFAEELTETEEDDNETDIQDNVTSASWDDEGQQTPGSEGGQHLEEPGWAEKDNETEIGEWQNDTLSLLLPLASLGRGRCAFRPCRSWQRSIWRKRRRVRRGGRRVRRTRRSFRG